MSLEALKQTDPEIHALCVAEERRQAEKIRLIPSENYVSHGGARGVRHGADEQVLRGLRRASATTRASSSSTRSRRWRSSAPRRSSAPSTPTSSPTPARRPTWPSTSPSCTPGDTIMGMALPHGGHLTHGWNVSITGRLWKSVQYGVRKETGRVDMDEVRELAREHKPEADLLRRHGHPAHDRLRGLRRDRARGRRRPRGRHRAHRRAWSPAARTRRRSPTPTSSRPRRTRRCAARAAA